MANNYELNDSVKVTVQFTDENGDPADPTTVTGEFKTPSDVTTVYTFGVDSELVKTGVGAYEFVITANEAGTWFYEFEGSGSIVATSSGIFNVVDPATTGNIVTNSLNPYPLTLLSLERYARIMELDPVHFNQAYTEDHFPVRADCPDVWYKYGWQKPTYSSRMELARSIKDAEEEIARVIHFWPAPTWIPAEERAFDKFHRREYREIDGWYDIAGGPKTVNTRYSRILAVGRRNVALAADSAGIVWSDNDGDGFLETATITVDISGTPAEDILSKSWFRLNQTCFINAYYEDTGGRPEWQIRPPRSQTLSGTTLTMVFYAWQLIKPIEIESYPRYSTSEPKPIDISDINNLVTDVDIYLEYPDLSQPSAEFDWGRGSSCDSCFGAGCDVCNPTTQTGCAAIEDGLAGIVSAKPATYDATNEKWVSSTPSIKQRSPDSVKIWYLSGMLDRDFSMGYTCDPLDDYYAQAIAWLATARLNKNICACTNSLDRAKELRRDMAVSSGQQNFIVVPDDVIKNPFGTRVGEVRAWRRVSKIMNERALSGAVL